MRFCRPLRDFVLFVSTVFPALKRWAIFKRLIFSVKGGNLKLDDVRALDSVVKAHETPSASSSATAAIGVLLSIEEPTAKMKEWAATCGFHTSAFNGRKYPRIQLRTIGQLLDGVAIERPSGNVAVDETFKKAPRAKAKGHGQDVLDL